MFSHLIIFTLISSTICLGMEYNFESKDQIIDNLIKNTRITKLKEIDPVMKVHLIKQEHGAITLFKPLYFVENYSDDNTLYLTAIKPAFEGQKLLAIAHNYKLFRIAQKGNKEMLQEALKDAKITFWDETLGDIRFILKTIEGTTCTRDDIDNKRFVYLAKSDRPVIFVSPYSVIAGFTLAKHALSNYHLDMFQEIKNNNLFMRGDEGMMEIDVDALQKELQEEQQNLQKAQEKKELPLLPLGPAIEYHADNSPYTWETPYLNIDALARVYVSLICFDDQQGKMIVNNLKKWGKYRIFTIHVLRHISDLLEKESYQDQSLLPDNIVSFAEQFIEKFSAESEKTLNGYFYTWQIARLSATMLCLAASKAYDDSGKVLNNEWKKWHDQFLEKIINTNFSCSKNSNATWTSPGTEFLKNIYELNNYMPFVAYIKPMMQKVLLQKYWARVLKGDGPLGHEKYKVLVDHVISFLKPEEEKQTFKK